MHHKSKDRLEPVCKILVSSRIIFKLFICILNGKNTPANLKAPFRLNKSVDGKTIF